MNTKRKKSDREAKWVEWIVLVGSGVYDALKESLSGKMGEIRCRDDKIV